MSGQRIPGFEGITIRPVSEADAQGLARFYQQLSPEPDYFFRPYRDKSVAAMAHVAKQSLAGREDGYVVLNREATVVGHIFFGDLSKDTPHLGIGLADEYRDSGLGTALMQFLIAVARKKLKKQAIGLSVMKTNGRAIQVYEKCGFRITGECTFRSPDDSYVMKLAFERSGQQDQEVLDAFFARILGLDPQELLPGEIRVACLDGQGAATGRQGEQLAVYAFLRRGRLVILARSQYLKRVEGLLSEARLPEEIFAEAERSRLREIVSEDLAGQGPGQRAVAEWAVCFYCPCGGLRFQVTPAARVVAAEAEAMLREVLCLCGESDRSLSSSDVAPRAVLEAGRVVAGGAALRLSEKETDMVGIAVGARPGSKEKGLEEVVLSELIVEAQRQGRTVMAEAACDDIPRIRAYQKVGMHSYADILRVSINR